MEPFHIAMSSVRKAQLLIWQHFEKPEKWWGDLLEWPFFVVISEHVEVRQSRICILQASGRRESGHHARRASASKRNRESLSHGGNREGNTGAVPYQIDEKMLSDLNVRLSHDEALMEDMEKDFQAVIKDLLGNESLGRFRTEYEKLHNSIKMAHENEMKLMSKCRDLHAEIVSNR